MKVAVIGSRALPVGFSEKVVGVVGRLLMRGHEVCHGGAMGADHFVLQALINCRAASKGILFSAWESVLGFPAQVQPDIQKYLAAGGQLSPPLAGGHLIYPPVVGKFCHTTSHAKHFCNAMLKWLTILMHWWLFCMVSHGVPVSQLKKPVKKVCLFWFFFPVPPRFPKSKMANGYHSKMPAWVWSCTISRKGLNYVYDNTPRLRSGQANKIFG